MLKFMTLYMYIHKSMHFSRQLQPCLHCIAKLTELTKEISDTCSPDTNKHLIKLRPRTEEERYSGLACNSLSKKSLPCSWRTNQKDPWKTQQILTCSGTNLSIKTTKLKNTMHLTPYFDSPVGIFPPSLLNLSGFLRNSTTSFNSCFASST